MTDPLTPPECDLRDYPWMPVDIHRLLTSETWILGSPEEKVAAFTMWCEAWRQVPAGSLPSDDRMLAHLSGAAASWKRVKEHVMRGWITCSDGRLYHPTVCEKAREAWAAKLKIRARVNRRLEMESGEWADLRSSVFLRDDFTCRYCGVRGARLECDHVIPISRGGLSSHENLVTACRPCNRRKGARTTLEWMQ